LLVRAPLWYVIARGTPRRDAPRLFRADRIRRPCITEQAFLLRPHGTRHPSLPRRPQKPSPGCRSERPERRSSDKDDRGRGCRGFARRQSRTSRPSNSGKVRSRITRSKPCWGEAQRNASTPFAASVTTQPSRRSCSSISRGTSGASVATKARGLSVAWAHLLGDGCACLRWMAPQPLRAR